MSARSLGLTKTWIASCAFKGPGMYRRRRASNCSRAEQGRRGAGPPPPHAIAIVITEQNTCD
eukprot:1533451-Pleurochrysis_carterae.AAC.1